MIDFMKYYLIYSILFRNLRPTLVKNLETIVTMNYSQNVRTISGCLKKSWKAWIELAERFELFCSSLCL